MRDFVRLGQIVRSARLAHGLSLNGLRAKHGFDLSLISRIENASIRSVPTPETIRRIARALDLNEIELLQLAGHISEGAPLRWERPRAWRVEEITRAA